MPKKEKKEKVAEVSGEKTEEETVVSVGGVSHWLCRVDAVDKEDFNHNESFNLYPSDSLQDQKQTLIQDIPGGQVDGKKITESRWMEKEKSSQI